MKKLPKKIRVITGMGWYQDNVGDEFEVTGRLEEYNAYYVRVWDDFGDMVDDSYFIIDGNCEIVEEEPTPQLAGIHDSLAKLALELTELKRKVDANTNDIAFLDEKRLSAESLTPLQLAILNAENTPADVKLTLIVEAGRLESERKATLKEAE